MRCPFCQHHDLKVTDTRESGEGRSIRRRRECLACHRRFTTFETIELSSLQVQKRKGRYEQFSFEKLLIGIQKACRHTHISDEEACAIATAIQGELLQTDATSIPSREIGDLVMEKLKEKDEIAYIRFACEYRRFKDINELIDEIEHIAPKGGSCDPSGASLTH